MKSKKIFVSIVMFGLTISIVSAKNRDLLGIDLITRQERGADETRRYAEQAIYQSFLQSEISQKQKLEDMKQNNFNKYLKEKEKSYHKELANEYLMNNYGEEYSIDSKNTLYNNHELRQTELFKENKTKIIIHHTADTTPFHTKKDVLKYLQKTYRFHAFTRGRGDIGYNFLIDPFGNIYEGRAGGENIVATHTLWNNTPSIGIALMGNFEIQSPSVSQLTSLVKLLSALSKKYNIDPFHQTAYHRKSQKAPYLETLINYSIVGHRDTGYTACPGKNLEILLPNIRRLVQKTLAGESSKTDQKSISTTVHNTTLQAHNQSGLSKNNPKNNYYITEKLLQNTKFKSLLQHRKSLYYQQHLRKTQTFNKITHKITVNEAKQYLQQKIHVLLYELSQNFDTWEISCTHQCNFVLDQKSFHSGKATIKDLGDKLSINIDNHTYYSKHLSVSSDGQYITINNYNRKSYTGIPWNSFKGILLFNKETIYNKSQDIFEKKYAIINILNFDDYLKGIVETNDNEDIEKNKAMAMIAKSYALFYMHPQNIHPNIPEGAHYNAIDDPDLFQKYVGAGLENTLHKRYIALNQTKNLLATYQGYIPILPYFSCSAGFTKTAKETRGWKDTPYLQSHLDFAQCTDFQGHGVGLSGKGAERRAKQGRNREQILYYYYRGIAITHI